MSDDFSLLPLKKALAGLEEILSQPKNKFMVAGTVQNFEYTFELSWKAMQRFLKLRGVDTGSPMQTFRAAKKEGLIQDVEVWAEYLKKRNLTVHTYNEKTAEEVYLAAKQFPLVVNQLIAKIEAEEK